MKHQTNRRNRRKQKVIRRCARIQGGNWQGIKYLSYAEHDECTRAALAQPYAPEVAYMKRREAIEARR